MTDRVIKKRSNLRDVASHAGVSVATVSRVLNAPDKVSDDTRERVEDAIAALKFAPSAAARAINSGRTRMVAALLPTLDNAIYARLVNGLERRLAMNGLSLIVAQTSDSGPDELARATRLIGIGAEALIVAGVRHDEGLFDLVERTQAPLVGVSYFDKDGRLPTVGYDNWAAARLAATHLADQGHRKVVVLHGPTDTNDRMQRRRSALEAGIGDVDFSFLEVPISMEGGFKAVERILAGPDRPTAVLCFSDVIAYGVLSNLQTKGHAVPDDFAVMGMEDLPASEFTYPALTSVRLSVEEMGVRAAEAVSNWLETDVRPKSEHLPIELVVRASTHRKV